MVPLTPPQSRAQGFSTGGTGNELFTGSSSYPATSYTPGPYGLGVRRPMIVISPWSKGGWVNSQVFDHTSLIRFIERRFGVTEPNITPWRRAVDAPDFISADQKVGEALFSLAVVPDYISSAHGALAIWYSTTAALVGVAFLLIARIVYKATRVSAKHA